MHDLPPGKIVLLAGGTGIYPFSDTIDLLFKDHLVDTGSPYAAAIKEADPIVGKGLFKPFVFTIYIAVNDFDELHPITMYECN